MQSVSICDVFGLGGGVFVVVSAVLQFQFVVITQKLLNYINLVVWIKCVHTRHLYTIAQCLDLIDEHVWASDTYVADEKKTHTQKLI